MSVGRIPKEKVDLLLDARVTLAEGPIWHVERQELTWIDFVPGKVQRVSLDGAPGAALEVGRYVGSAVGTRSDTLLLAAADGFATITPDGRYAVIHEIEAQTPDTFMTDGKCDPAGRFWAGTVAADVSAGAGSLYRLDLDGSVERMVSGVTLSNGLGWSPDGLTFYYTDSSAGGVDAFDFDVASGAISRRRRLVTISAEEGLADGLTVDAEGCLWIAVFGAGEVRRFTPDGTLDRIVELPVSQAASCTFAGSDLGTLVITTAAVDLTDEQQREQPHAGSLFCCRPGVAGLAADVYGGQLAAGSQVTSR